MVFIKDGCVGTEVKANPSDLGDKGARKASCWPEHAALLGQTGFGLSPAAVAAMLIPNG